LTAVDPYEVPVELFCHGKARAAAAALRHL
jgi:hypothetical protein